MYGWYVVFTFLLMFLYKINIYTILLALTFLLLVVRHWYLTYRGCRHAWKIKLSNTRILPKPITICLICGIVKPIKDKKPTLSESKNRPKGLLSSSLGQILLSIAILVTGAMGIAYILSSQLSDATNSAVLAATMILMPFVLFLIFLNPAYKEIHRNENVSGVPEISGLKIKALLCWIGWMVALLVIGKP
jgi:hypothetical protein